MNKSFYSITELRKLGFKELGKNVLISRFAKFYDIENIEIGSNVRIDDFCLLSGEIRLGNYIHISAYSALYGKFGILMEDYSGLSPRCTVFSATDDFNGEFLVGPMVPPEYINIYGSKIIIGKYSQIGSSSIILPGAKINEGVAVGAMSLVKSELNEWSIYAGNPIKFIKPRKRNIIDLVKDFESRM